VTRRKREHDEWHEFRVAGAAILTLLAILVVSELTDYDPPDPPAPEPPQTVEQGRREEAVRATRGDGRAEILPGLSAPTPDASDRPEDAGKRQLSRPVVGQPWAALAECESGGDWQINTGNGFYGGLQFSLTSWQGVGGSGYPHEASVAEQIHRAELLQAVQGWGAWPSCSVQVGLR